MPLYKVLTEQSLISDIQDQPPCQENPMNIILMFYLFFTTSDLNPLCMLNSKWKKKKKLKIKVKMHSSYIVDQTPQNGTPTKNCTGTSGHSLEHIQSTTNTAIHVHFHSPVHNSGYLCQGINLVHRLNTYYKILFLWYELMACLQQWHK